MACCGEAWDPQYDDVYLQNCTYDLIQQVCISLAKRLEDYILDGKFGNHAGQAAALQSWIAEHYVNCFETLLQNNSNPGPGALESSWKIPNSAAWHLIQNMEIHIDAGTEATGVLRPPSPDDWIFCHGADGNNDGIFEDKHGPNGGVVAGVDLNAPVLGELVGPMIFGNVVSASVAFETGSFIHSFAIRYEDGSGNDWTVTLAESRWR